MIHNGSLGFRMDLLFRGGRDGRRDDGLHSLDQRGRTNLQTVVDARVNRRSYVSGRTREWGRVCVDDNG